jgi:hypothetical protein
MFVRPLTSPRSGTRWKSGYAPRRRLPCAVPDLARQCAGNAPPRLPINWAVPRRACAVPFMPFMPGSWLHRSPNPAGQTDAGCARCRQSRAVASSAARAAPCLWQIPQYLDAAFGSRGLLGARAHAAPGQHRDDSPRPQTLGRQLVTRQALDHERRSAVRVKKAM